MLVSTKTKTKMECKVLLKLKLKITKTITKTKDNVFKWHIWCNITLFKPVLSLFLINTKTKNNFSKTILFWLTKEILLKLKLKLKLIQKY